jgi:5-methyltetrahydrofolate--homocysteine methyltransferase
MPHDWQTLKDDWVELLLSGQEAPAIEQARALLAEGISPQDFFQNIITPALEEIGRRFEELEIFLPELATAGETVQALSDAVINPALEAASQQRTHHGTVVLGTVQGDLHNIGKNMVGLMLSVHGFTVVDLGTNVSPVEFVNRAEKERADIIAMSALLMTTLPYMKDVVDRLVALRLRDKYRVIIGGAPTSPEVAQKFGADAYGANAAEAVRICRELMATRQAIA